MVDNESKCGLCGTELSHSVDGLGPVCRRKLMTWSREKPESSLLKPIKRYPLKEVARGRQAAVKAYINSTEPDAIHVLNQSGPDYVIANLSLFERLNNDYALFSCVYRVSQSVQVTQPLSLGGRSSRGAK